jgi:hypothetical protein
MLHYRRSRFVQLDFLGEKIGDLERGLDLTFKLEVEALVFRVLGDLSLDDEVSDSPNEEGKVKTPDI